MSSASGWAWFQGPSPTFHELYSKNTRCRWKSRVRMLRKLLEEMDETRKRREISFLTLCDPKNICGFEIQGWVLDTAIPNLFPTYIWEMSHKDILESILLLLIPKIRNNK